MRPIHRAVLFPLAFLATVAATGAFAQPVTILDLAAISTDSGTLQRIYGADGNGAFGVPVAGGSDMDGDGHVDYAVAFMTADPLFRGDVQRRDRRHRRRRRHRPHHQRDGRQCPGWRRHRQPDPDRRPEPLLALQRRLRVRRHLGVVLGVQRVTMSLVGSREPRKRNPWQIIPAT